MLVVGTGCSAVEVRWYPRAVAAMHACVCVSDECHPPPLTFMLSRTYCRGPARLIGTRSSVTLKITYVIQSVAVSDYAAIHFAMCQYILAARA